MQLLIVVTSTEQQARSWQQRLALLKGSLYPEESRCIVVHEDWPGGAGNGLGTLYAFKKAQEALRLEHGEELSDLLRAGAFVALYHTAGKGMRLAPLVGAAASDKSSVELPSRLDGTGSCLRLLEAVIKQTQLLTTWGRGRLSVFWGDQLFLPEKPIGPAQHHVELLARFQPMPSLSEWQSQELSRYGVLCLGQGQTQLLEKVEFSQLQQLQQNSKVDTSRGIALSLGSFSLSWHFLEALLHEFTPELTARRGRLDTDPHFWMPLTLDSDTYCAMRREEKDPLALQQRLQSCARRVQGPLFGACDVGQRSDWWDYGTVASYYQQALKLCADSEEAVRMRRFFQLSRRVDNHSCIEGCQIGSGDIRNSVVIGVVADRLELDHCVLIGGNYSTLQATESLLYHVQSPLPLRLAPGTVRADVQTANRSLPFHSSLQRDGKRDWQVRLEGNPLSYQEMFELQMRDTT